MRHWGHALHLPLLTLLYTANTDGAIGATAATKEAASRQSTFLAIHARLRWRDNVPVSGAIVILGPSVSNTSAMAMVCGSEKVTYAPGI